MIAIDRLILEIPGMSPARAERLARAVGAMIVQAGAQSTDRLQVTVADGASDGSILAALAASLRTGAR